MTALVVRDYLGGELLIAEVFRDGRMVERHCWNRLPSGLEIDLTREQYRRAELIGAPAAHESLIKARDAGDRLLAARVRARLDAQRDD